MSFFCFAALSETHHAVSPRPCAPPSDSSRRRLILPGRPRGRPRGIHQHIIGAILALLPSLAGNSLGHHTDREAFRIPRHPSAWIHLHPLAHSHVMTRQSASCVAHRQRDRFSHAPPSAPPSTAPAPLGRHQCSTGSSLLGPILCRPTAASACRASLPRSSGPPRPAPTCGSTPRAPHRRSIRRKPSRGSLLVG